VIKNVYFFNIKYLWLLPYLNEKLIFLIYFRKTSQYKISLISVKWKKIWCHAQFEGQWNVVNLKVTYNNFTNDLAMEENQFSQGVGACNLCIVQITYHFKLRERRQ
jgi:hypothetical protein